MKLFKRLTIDGEIFPLVKEDVRLQLGTPGRAYFVTTKPVPKGIVQLNIGYSPDKIYRYFFGFIESASKIDSNHFSLFCQEFGAALNRRIITNLRHVALKDVLAEISRQTAIQFLVPDSDYAKTLAPCFYSTGGGYHCMDSLRNIFNIPQFVWQQQSSGQIFVGSWSDSRWRDRPVSIPRKFLTNHGVKHSATLPIVPALRPGVQLSGFGLITKVSLNHETININWSEQFWTKPLKSW